MSASPPLEREALELEVPAALRGKRLDQALVVMLAEEGVTVTRAEVARWIDAGDVTLDGRSLKRKWTVKTGVLLRVVPGQPAMTEAVPDPTVPFDVVHEDAHLVVVDKPAGVVVHPARGHRTGTLVNGLLARGGFERASADPRDPEGHLRPGIVHRIDKDTSGLLVVAKDATTREGLKALFQRHDIERVYRAIVVGQARRARYDTPHGRHRKNRLKFTSLLDDDAPHARRAVTEVTPLEPLSGGTLVACTLETGRTHQIRVHLAEQARTPILADPLYGLSTWPVAVREAAQALARQALHAAVLGFVHPITGARLRFESPLPADMAAALDRLRA